ncbi:hypothetical protein MUP77_04920 [Candidatus Bathyarchaeota archaeon]|nr:hypothetical protein [Candidatus Bathyarchaeota archaeon]
MVSKRRVSYLAVIFIILSIQIVLINITIAQAQITYTISKEWAKVWVNQDLSIDVFYNVTLTYLSGAPQGIFQVGMPKGGFQILSAKDISGTSLQASDVSSGGLYLIDVTLKQPVALNQPITFTLFVNVPGMVQLDKTNPGNAGMEFYPSTFTNPPPVSSIGDVRVAIVLPQGVNSSQVKYPTDTHFDSISMEGNNLVVFWNRTNWSASQQLKAGVSFPDKYVNFGPSILLYLAIVLGVLVIIAIIAIVVLRRFRKAPYEKPKVAVEALGALHGLTAVEAALVIALKPARVLTMILFGLMMKHKIQVTATEPLVKVKELQTPQGTAVPSLRYYEIDYLKSIDPNGTFNEMRLAQTYLGLRANVDRRLKGYSRTDTMNYYKSVVAKAFDQVSRAGTPELRGEAVEQNIDWLLADENLAGRFNNLPGDAVILPRLGWWWYWYWPPTGPTARTGSPPVAGDVKPIPIQEFANNMVKGLETTSNNIVKDIQSFTNRLVAPQQAADRSVRGASHCVCACHACACACACVGCACACAGGGAR